MILSQLAKLATIYDQMGQIKKADRLDTFINKWAQAETEPTYEDVMKEEEWLIQEDAPTDDSDDEGETYFEEEPLELETVPDPMNSPEILSLLEQLEGQKNRILEQLKKLSGEESVPSPESSLMQDLETLANLLDAQKMYKQASFFDGMLTKLAQGVPPDDMFNEPLPEEIFDDMEFSVREEEEPLEGSVQKQMLTVLTKLEDGTFKTLQEAQDAARKVMQEYDRSIYSEKDFGSVSPTPAERARTIGNGGWYGVPNEDPNMGPGAL